MRKTRARYPVLKYDVCPICMCMWADGWEGKVAGAKCGDLSRRQHNPCVGRLVPFNEYTKAEWRDEWNAANRHMITQVLHR